MAGYFAGCRTAADIKRRYRELAQKLHPDHGGSTADMQDLNAQYESALKRLFDIGLDAFEAEKGYRPNVRTDWFGDVLKAILEMNVTVEVIGWWVYVFDAYEYREALKGLGCWWSAKHKAWVFNGGQKRPVRSKLTTDDIRVIHGSEILRLKKAEEREERAALAQ